MAELSVEGVACTYEIRGENAVMLCPPHPEMGGSRYDVRLERIADELKKAGFSTLRFDYSKPYRLGIGEIEDARKCILHLKARHASVGIVGYSFGSVVASNLAEYTDALVLVSPLRKIDKIELKNSKIPKLIISARKDQIVPFEDSKEIFDWFYPPKEFFDLETDHFYFGKFDVLARRIREFMESVIL
ncbi:MAG: dienelactone hydrolase family protein [Archaeoglobus sp.]|nr:dienelactone hydrolase family protein [Archaeoglobus sp.]